jgi:hypothetical protein
VGLRLTLGRTAWRRPNAAHLSPTLSVCPLGKVDIGEYSPMSTSESLILWQTSIVYFASAAIKLQGEAWIQGIALYTIFNVDEYSLPFAFAKEIFYSPILTTLFTYATIVYQIGFPFMLFNKLHLIWVVIGILFHLGIFIFMGLTTFSIIMIALILFTISDREWLYVLGHIGKLRLLLDAKSRLKVGES